MGYIFSLLIFPVLIGKYGQKETGVIFTVQSISLIITSISNYSFTYYIPTVSGHVCKDRIYMIKLWNLVLIVRTFFSLFLSIVVSTLVFLFYNDYFMIWILSTPLILAKIINPTLFCNALENNKYVFKIGFLTNLMFLICVIIGNNSNLVNFYLGFSEIIVCLFYLTKIDIGLNRLKIVSFSEIKAFLRQTSNLFLMNVLLILKPNAILPAISFFLGFEYATLFSIAQKVLNVVKSLSGNIFTSYFPIYNKEEIKYSFMSIKVLISVLFFTILIIACFWYFSPYIVYFLNDSKPNYVAVATLRIMSFSIPVFFLMIPLFGYLLNHKKWNFILVFTVLQLFVLVVFIYILIGENIVGVAKSIMISEYLLFFMYVFLVSKMIGFKKLKDKI